MLLLSTHCHSNMVVGPVGAHWSVNGTGLMVTKHARSFNVHSTQCMRKKSIDGQRWVDKPRCTRPHESTHKGHTG